MKTLTTLKKCGFRLLAPLALAAAISLPSCGGDVKQPAIIFGIDPSNIDIGREGGGKLVNVTCAANWTAAVTSVSPWCGIDKTSGTGNGIITVTVEPNDSYGSRTATIELSDGNETLTLTVTQAATPQLDPDPAELKLTGAGEGATASVSIVSNGDWTVGSDQVWCKTDKAGGTGNGTVTVTADPNMTTVRRTATLTLAMEGLTKTVGVEQNGIPVEVVSITAGSFVMGSPDTEPERIVNETQHTVTLTKGFHMGKYEITNRQYADFLNAKAIGGDGKGNVTYDKAGGPVTENQTFIFASSGSADWGLNWSGEQWISAADCDDAPVINVTWFGAKAYADWAGGALPTEAQWEYACRAVNTAPFGLGDGTKLDYTMANFDCRYSYALPGGQYVDIAHTSFGKTKPTGSYQSNARGVFDMHGNVWEWCADWYDEKYGSADATDAVTDPTGPATGTYRMMRGGGWYSDARDCRSARRAYELPTTVDIDSGFRVVFNQK